MPTAATYSQPLAGVTKTAWKFVSTFGINWEARLYVILLITAAVLRFWDLEGRAIHYDESLHAMAAWKIEQGMGYVHQPWMHGPFQFYATVPIFWLFGSSDFTVRVIPAIFGVILVGMPYLLRDQLGKTGSLAVALLFTISPTVLYFSRFARDDVYILVWTLALVILIWRYLRDQKAAYLYWSAAIWALSFVTMENTFITLAVFGGFLLFLAARDFLRFLAARELIKGLKNRARLFASFPAITYIVFLVALILPLFAAAAAVPLRWLGVDLPRWTFSGGQGAHVTWAVVLTVALFAVAAIIGLRWKWKTRLITAAIFYGIVILFFTSFFQNARDGMASGFWGSLDYWLVVHGENRISQPGYYYLMILSVYEFLPLFFAVIGGVYYAVKGDLFSRFLVYWMLASLIAYSIAGEKTPWLAVHMALPIILLAGKFLGQVLSRFSLKRSARSTAAYLALSVFLIATVVLTARAAVGASFSHREYPIEMLIYAQGSQEVSQIADQVDTMSIESGPKDKFKVTLDSSVNGIWVWPWYFRDITVDWFYPESVNPDSLGSVLIIGTANTDKLQPYLDKYREDSNVRSLMWFPDGYKGTTWSKIARNLISLRAWKNGWDYFLYRNTSYSTDPGDAKVYFLKSQ